MCYNFIALCFVKGWDQLSGIEETRRPVNGVKSAAEGLAVLAVVLLAASLLADSTTPPSSFWGRWRRCLQLPRQHGYTIG